MVCGIKNALCTHVLTSLVPRPLPVFFFVLWFASNIIYRSGRAAKNGEGLGTPITWMTSGGHRERMVHIQINVLDFIIERSNDSQEPKHSRDRQYSTSQVRNSLYTFYYTQVFPGLPRFLAAHTLWCIMLNANQKWGRHWNEATHVPNVNKAARLPEKFSTSIWAHIHNVPTDTLSSLTSGCKLCRVCSQQTSGELSTSSRVRRVRKSPSRVRLQLRNSPLTHASCTISLRSCRPSVSNYIYNKCYSIRNW